MVYILPVNTVIFVHSVNNTKIGCKNNKSAVADVPEVVGSMFGTGFLFLAGGIGVALGVGGTLGTLKMMKKKKSGADASDTATDHIKNS